MRALPKTPKLWPALRAVNHASSAAACFVASWWATGGSTGSTLLLAALLSSTSALGALLRGLLSPRRSVPAPADVQRLVDDLAAQMGAPAIRVVIGDNTPGLASLAGLTARSRHIEISQRALMLPVERLLALVAHELGHAIARHQARGLLNLVAATIIPQLVAVSVAASKAFGIPGPTTWAATSAAVASVLAMLLLHKSYRSQEHEADGLLAERAGERAREQFLLLLAAAHTSSPEADGGNWYDTHPPAAERVRRLVASS